MSSIPPISTSFRIVYASKLLFQSPFQLICWMQTISRWCSFWRHSCFLITTSADPVPLYKDPNANVEVRVSDLLSRMTVSNKVSQLVQGDISMWLNTTTNELNFTGLQLAMTTFAGQFYVGHTMPWEWLSNRIKVAQDYLIRNTTLGIPALVQSEGIHGFRVSNATIFNSPIGYACSWNPGLVRERAAVIAKESSALGFNQLYAPLGVSRLDFRISSYLFQDISLSLNTEVVDLTLCLLIGLSSRTEVWKSWRNVWWRWVSCWRDWVCLHQG